MYVRRIVEPILTDIFQQQPFLEQCHFYDFKSVVFTIYLTFLRQPRSYRSQFYAFITSVLRIKRNHTYPIFFLRKDIAILTYCCTPYKNKRKYLVHHTFLATEHCQTNFGSVLTLLSSCTLPDIYLCLT